MYYLDGRRRCQSLVYFGNSKGSSANVAAGQCLPGASRVSSRAATRKQMVAATDYDELRIWEPTYPDMEAILRTKPQKCCIN